MSRPSFENIDQWLFEYTEGNLSPVQESQLMDFISLHPELMSELKSWQQAKVAPKPTPAFSTAALVKPMPFYLHPVIIVAIGLIVLFFGWVGHDKLTTVPLYTMSDIDTDIIHSGDEDLFDDSFLVLNNAKTSTSEVRSTKSSNLKTVSSSNQNRKTNQDLNIPILSPQHNNLAENETENLALLEDEMETNQIASSTDKQTIKIDYSELQEKQNSFNAKANDLNLISEYLNQSPNTEKEDITSSAKVISGAEVAKVSLKKTLYNTYRKIKRMADQPVALRNTKAPHYHAPMMTGFNANSAMVGSAPGNRIQATSRIQWLDKSNTQLLNSLSWDGYVYALRGGLGVDVNYNGYNSNALNNYSVGLTYSPKLSINKSVSIEPALRFKMGVVNVDPNSDFIGQKIEVNRHNLIPLFENEAQVSGSQLWYKDIGLGFMLNTKWFYAGFNADNLGRHNNNFYTGDLSKDHRENIHYTAVIGTEYQSMTRDIKVSGYGLFQNFGDLTELWIGGNFQYKWIQAGAGLNTNTEFGASLGTVFNRFSFHYNIDYTKSQLLNNKYLSHQVSMMILLKPSRYAAKFLNI